MTLAKPLREILAMADLLEQQKSMGIKSPPLCLHQIIAGPDGEATLAQAQDYARELISRGILKNTPVQLDCNQPMSDDMVQNAFRDAKKGLLLVHGLEHLAREETFTSLAERAAKSDSCIVVMCGTAPAFKRLLTDYSSMAMYFPTHTDLGDAVIARDIQEHERQERERQIQEQLKVRDTVQPMKPIKFK